MVVSAECLDGGAMRLSAGIYSVDIAAPLDVQSLDIAAQHIIEKVAGISKHDFVIAMSKAVLPKCGRD